MSGMIGAARVGARMSPKQRLAVRHIDSAPFLSDRCNWFRGSCHRGGGRSGGLACRLWLCHRPEWMFAPELKSGAVVSELEDWSLSASDVRAVLPTGRQVVRRLAPFTMFMERHLSKEAGQQTNMPLPLQLDRGPLSAPSCRCARRREAASVAPERTCCHQPLRRVFVVAKYRRRGNPWLGFLPADVF
jgi:hypothetical protein